MHESASDVNRQAMPAAQPCCVDKSASLSANCWWKETTSASVPPSQLTHDLGKPSRRRDGDFTRVGSRREDDGRTERLGGEQNGNCCGNIDKEAICGRAVGGLMGDRASVKNNFSSSSSIRNNGVSVSSDKRAETVRDRRSDIPTPQSPSTVPKISSTQAVGLRKWERSLDCTKKPGVVTASYSVSSSEKSQNAPTSFVGTDKTVGRSTEPVTADDRLTAISSANGEHPTHKYKQNSSIEFDTIETGSTSTGRKRIPSENEDERASALDDHLSVTMTTKPPNRHENLTNRENIEIAETQPNIPFPFVSGTRHSSTVTGHVRADRNFGGSSIAKHDSVHTKDGAVSEGNSATKSDRSAYGKSPSDVPRLTSSPVAPGRAVHVKPAVESPAETLSSRSRELSSSVALKMRASTNSGTPTKDTDEARRATANDAVSITKLTDGTTVLADGLKRRPVDGSAVPENQNSSVQFKNRAAVDSSITEPPNSVSPMISRLKRAVNQDAFTGVSDAMASDGGKTGDSLSL